MPGNDPDDDSTRPPPHPLDRPWIHPSELLATSRGAASIPQGSRRRWPRDLALTLTAGTVGAVATVALLGIAGAFAGAPAARVRTEATAPPTDAATIATQVAPGVAAVITTVAGTERRGSGIAVGTHQILTTTAVVEAGDGRVEICMENGRRHPATEIGRDAVSGLVLLNVPTLRTVPARLADTDAVRAGDWIVAVGRTATSGSWVTSGVVTAVGGWVSDDAGITHAGLITTSADVAEEARGGALVDRRGHVVGILSVSATAPTRTAAMPASVIRDIAAQLAQTGTASHGALGIRAADSEVPGAIVNEIADGSGAEAGGLMVGDRIVAVNNARTSDSAALVVELRRHRAGTHVRLAVKRGKHTMTVRVVLDEASVTTDPADVPDPTIGPSVPANPESPAVLTTAAPTS